MSGDLYGLATVVNYGVILLRKIYSGTMVVRDPYDVKRAVVYYAGEASRAVTDLKGMRGFAPRNWNGGELPFLIVV